MRGVQIAVVFVAGLIIGAAGAIVVGGPKQYARGLEAGRHEIRLDAIKAEAATIKAGTFTWTPAR
jgi:hypothetical protein